MIYGPLTEVSGASKAPDHTLIVPTRPEDVVWILNGEGAALAVDGRVHDLVGDRAEELLREGGGAWWGRVHPADRARLHRELEAVFARARAFEVECRLQRSNGRWIRVAARPVAIARWNDEACVYVVMRRVTGHRETRRRELRTLAEYRAVCATAPVVVARRREERDYALSFVSANVRRLLGFTPSEVLRASAFLTTLVHADDRARVHDAVRRAAATGHATCDYRVLHKNGRHHWIREEMHAMRNDGPSSQEILSYWSLVSEERRWEEACRRLEISVHLLEARVPDAVAVCVRGRIVQANPALLEVLGRASSEVVGCEAGLFVDRRDRPALEALVQEEPRPSAIPRLVDLRWLDRAGEASTLRCSSLPIVQGGSPAVLLIGTPC